MASMDVRQIMTTGVVTVELDDKLVHVKDLFDHHRFHHLLVIDGKQLCGVVSDRDLLKAMSPNLGTIAETAKDLATLEKRVHQIMTRKPIVLREDSSVDDAIRLFNKHRISCLPVVDSENKPIGIVTWRDLLKAWRPGR
jgi:acetoin utilization protein AcuB